MQSPSNTNVSNSTSYEEEKEEKEKSVSSKTRTCPRFWQRLKKERGTGHPKSSSGVRHTREKYDFVTALYLLIRRRNERSLGWYQFFSLKSALNYSCKMLISQWFEAKICNAHWHCGPISYWPSMKNMRSMLGHVKYFVANRMQDNATTVSIDRLILVVKLAYRRVKPRARKIVPNFLN